MRTISTAVASLGRQATYGRATRIVSLISSHSEAILTASPWEIALDR